MRNSRVINIAAGTTMLGAAVFLFFSFNEVPPSPNRGEHQAVGRAMAREALRWVKPGGTIAAITRDTAAFQHPESDDQLAGFQAALREAGATLGPVQSLQVDPLRALEVPAGDFFEMIRKGKPGSVIVSFLGPPQLSPEQSARIGDARPAVVAFCPGAIPERTDLKPIFEAGLLQAAIVVRENPQAHARDSSPRTPGQEFEATYQVVGPNDLAPLDAFRREAR